ncbi:MAG: DIP1984 family protein [Muribaculaceae bacterium]|nr:DIP1984 family protein [Muribaculaceae bacterium]
MKLAEALSIRKDLQTRIEQLKMRIINNVRVQEGEQPAEEPKELLTELDSCLKQLQELIYRINVTNMHAKSGDKTLTQLMAERDVLTKRVQTLREVFNQASSSSERYSRSEIKYVTTIDVKAMGKQLDKLSSQLRTLDVEIQSINFATDLM